MFKLYSSSDIVTIIFCHSFWMLYHVLLCSCHPCDLRLFSPSLSLTIQLEKNVCHVINYNFIKTIKSEPTFGKSSISNQWSLSYNKEHLKKKIITLLKKQNISLVRFGSQWFDSTLCTSVFKLPHGGVTTIGVVQYAQRDFVLVLMR